MARRTPQSRYPIKVTEDAFAEDNATFQEVLAALGAAGRPKVALVADSSVVHQTERLGVKIGAYLQSRGVILAAKPVIVQAGEKGKMDKSPGVAAIANALVDARVGANDVVVILGGGTVLDMAGYAAAQVRGGLRVLRMPTTPAAMIDAAFASNAALNGPQDKDVFRVKCEPAAVVVDTLFARTVLDGVWRAGFGEAVRYAAVGDGKLMKRLAACADAYRDRDYETLREVVSACVASRAGAPTPPFALWCAARLESMSGYKLPHGYAVAIAACIDCAYAAQKGCMDAADRQLVCTALAASGSLEGIRHSQHILTRTEDIVRGLDGWALETGSPSIPLPGALGTSVEEPLPDRDAYMKVIADFMAASHGR